MKSITATCLAIFVATSPVHRLKANQKETSMMTSRVTSPILIPALALRRLAAIAVGY